ncbi:hypothetical protein [Streptomyces sp. NPDC056244]|uniref:hypothetical protein n=1 Tax=Streptomyces sp. NPDC056244 TaxID=3345762 RepID=UPI0035DA1355
MFEYELQKIRVAELIRSAERERLVREVRAARREARRQAGRRAGRTAGDTAQGPEGRQDGPGDRFVRAA